VSEFRQIPCNEYVIVQLISEKNLNIHSHPIKCQSIAGESLNFTWGLEKVPFNLDVEVDLQDLIKNGISAQVSIPDSLDFGGFGEKAVNAIISKGAGYLNNQIQAAIGTNVKLGDKEVKIFTVKFDISPTSAARFTGEQKGEGVPFDV
jgi:hypothetical protein